MDSERSDSLRAGQVDASMGPTLRMDRRAFGPGRDSARRITDNGKLFGNDL